jgi:hypothetical protein
MTGNRKVVDRNLPLLTGSSDRNLASGHFFLKKSFPKITSRRIPRNRISISSGVSIKPLDDNDSNALSGKSSKSESSTESNLLESKVVSLYSINPREDNDKSKNQGIDGFTSLDPFSQGNT